MTVLGDSVFQLLFPCPVGVVRFQTRLFFRFEQLVFFSSCSFMVFPCRFSKSFNTSCRSFYQVLRSFLITPPGTVYPSSPLLTFYALVGFFHGLSLRRRIKTKSIECKESGTPLG